MARRRPTEQPRQDGLTVRDIPDDLLRPDPPDDPRRLLGASTLDPAWTSWQQDRTQGLTAWLREHNLTPTRRELHDERRRRRAEGA